MVLCLVFDFHALLCSFSVSCVLPSVQFVSLSFLLCASHLVTSPGLLPPLSPHLLLIPSSMCDVPCVSKLLDVSGCSSCFVLVPEVPCIQPVSPFMCVFLDLDFCILICC